MRAIVIDHFGPGLDSLVIKEVPEPEPKLGHVVIEVKAFGINHAEMHMRKGEWAEAAEISADFNPLLQMASGVYLTFFGSFVFGTPQFPVSDVPLQTIAEKVAAGRYKGKPSRVFRFEDIREAHRVMEANEANGKLVVRL
jgi:NADPH:quinone reductase-like Zn-dependent oxidoreductase